jgi:branched-chain amino acid transport system permease protein
MKSLFKKYGVNVIAVVISYFILFFVMKMNLINSYFEGVMIFAMINIIVAIGLNIATGFLGELALGHAGFMAVGAYSAALFVRAVELPDTIALISGIVIGGLIAGVFGLIIGIPALRLRGDYLAIVTLGFGEMIRYTIINLRTITGGASGLRGIPKITTLMDVFLVLILVTAFSFLFIRSRHGRAIIAIRENEIAAESIGVPTTFYKVYAFFVSSFIAGVGGACFGMYQQYLTPDKFKFMFSVELFIIVVFGGMGSITGTIVAGVFLAMLAEFLYSYEELRLLIYAVLLILLMIFKSDGILGRSEFSLVKTPARIRALIIKLKKRFGKGVA